MQVIYQVENQMKKISCFAIVCACLAICGNADAAHRNRAFRGEVLRGLDSGRVNYSTRSAVPCDTPTIDATAASYAGAYGELGQEVFYDESPAKNEDYNIYVPTPMYVRMGGGLNIAGATKKARVGNEKHESRNSWNVLIGLGWNMSSYVRTEITFQESSFGFKGIDARADYHTLNGMLYFDFARRYVHHGDITYRRTFVPFMGIGAGIGEYEFAGPDGAGGFLVVAPRLELGMNFMLNDMIGLDLAYQYQMNMGHGFGWNTSRNGVDNIGNVVATIRVNF
jgi:hypothetical protein